MKDNATHVLILDDEKNYLLVLQSMLTDAGYMVTAINDPVMALDFMDESEVDVLVTDMKMPTLSGLQVLETVKKNYPHVPVLVMTAFGSIESAVEIMKLGAFDYITKPFSNDELLLSVQNAAALAKAHLRYRLLYENMQARFDRHEIIIGHSKGIEKVLDMVARAAPSRSNVLILGESGTGKELVARAIHLGSPRKDGPFISVNCMALNPGVLESELFGHEKGSFTGAVALRRGRFELANGGTLFLDEIGELSQDMQVKLLRVLQDRKLERVGGTEEIEVDIRIVAATNKDLLKAVEDKSFRDDLYYRLNVVQISLPALRERREDIPLLINHFMGKLTKDGALAPKKFTIAALDYLTGYEWPGNIRQLENIIERCLVMVPGDTVDMPDLPPEVRDEELQLKSAIDLLPVKLDLAATLDRLEAALIRRAMAKAEFVQVKAAALLGLSKTLLQYKLKKYNIGH
jgi:two-component system NtrC family response regulator